MAIKRDISELLTKEMDRKDFLKHLGIGVVALVGLDAIARTLNNLSSTSTTTTRSKATDRYGATAYGGSKLR